MIISLVVFLPFLKIKKVNIKSGLKFALIGAIQFGVMYITYIAAFKTLKAYEVALFTIFTPIYVVLIEGILQKKFQPLYLVTAIVAVIGTWIIKGEELLSPQILNGFLLVQLSNLCFAFGQVYYRKVMAKESELKDLDIFGLLYLGAAGLTAVSTLVFVPLSTITLTSTQVWTLLYLGAIASGLSFFLWNIGARKVNAGALAIFNDLKIPLAVFVSLMVFGEKTNLPKLLLGGAVMLIALAGNEWFSHRKIEAK
jgi:drug/metabolite transporter (DMT)-like permease